MIDENQIRGVTAFAELNCLYIQKIVFILLRKIQQFAINRLGAVDDFVFVFMRMDNETTTTKTAYLDILGAFAAKEAQVLVGTQMIAKGHDFPEVTLVGILDADMSLYHQDYRSNERTFQLVTQVAGRAGRSNKGGKVVFSSTTLCVPILP